MTQVGKARQAVQAVADGTGRSEQEVVLLAAAGACALALTGLLKTYDYLARMMVENGVGEVVGGGARPGGVTRQRR